MKKEEAGKKGIQAAKQIYGTVRQKKESEIIELMKK